ncbi:MAG: SpoIIIAH-like family protein [Bacilli bacterium]|jgi:stage III sporulation protein AH|nr:SpoIIIAH-like family protein [Bacilli bacterium]
MINKKSLWFLTLFSLILVLSVYYITMPSELLITKNKKNDEVAEVNKTVDKEASVEIEESEILTALRVEADEQMKQDMEDLQIVLTSVEATSNEKNEAYEKLQLLNMTRGEEEKLEKKIETKFKLKSFVKIDGDQIRVVASSDKHDTTLANDIMRSIQEEYKTKKYISVKFQK